MGDSMAILKLKPAQMGIGMVEADRQLAKLKDLNKKELKKFVKTHPVHVVIAPNGWHYLIDGHHHALSLHLLGVKKIRVIVTKDFSKAKISYEHFWKEMGRRHWVHLFDQFGKGPHDPLYLPRDIRGLGDDPYRSLAWLAQKNGAFEKTKIPFAEFRWANFFRRRKILHCKFEHDFAEKLEAATEFAASRSAKNLPGYKK